MGCELQACGCWPEGRPLARSAVCRQGCRAVPGRKGTQPAQNVCRTPAGCPFPHTPVVQLYAAAEVLERGLKIARRKRLVPLVLLLRRSRLRGSTEGALQQLQGCLPGGRSAGVRLWPSGPLLTPLLAAVPTFSKAAPAPSPPHPLHLVCHALQLRVLLQQRGVLLDCPPQRVLRTAAASRPLSAQRAAGSTNAGLLWSRSQRAPCPAECATASLLPPNPAPASLRHPRSALCPHSPTHLVLLLLVLAGLLRHQRGLILGLLRLVQQVGVRLQGASGAVG